MPLKNRTLLSRLLVPNRGQSVLLLPLSIIFAWRVMPRRGIGALQDVIGRKPHLRKGADI